MSSSNSKYLIWFIILASTSSLYTPSQFIFCHLLESTSKRQAPLVWVKVLCIHHDTMNYLNEMTSTVWFSASKTVIVWTMIYIGFHTCTLLYVHSSIAIILIGKRELVALLNLSSWFLVVVEWLFLAQCHGVVYGLWLWYFLIILTYYFRQSVHGIQYKHAYNIII